MFCKNCGGLVGAKAAVCPYCGAKLKDVPSSFADAKEEDTALGESQSSGTADAVEADILKAAVNNDAVSKTDHGVTDGAEQENLALSASNLDGADHGSADWDDSTSRIDNDFAPAGSSESLPYTDIVGTDGFGADEHATRSHADDDIAPADNSENLAGTNILHADRPNTFSLNNDALRSSDAGENFADKIVSMPEAEASPENTVNAEEGERAEHAEDTEYTEDVQLEDKKAGSRASNDAFDEFYEDGKPSRNFLPFIVMGLVLLLTVGAFFLYKTLSIDKQIDLRKKENNFEDLAPDAAKTSPTPDTEASTKNADGQKQDGAAEASGDKTVEPDNKKGDTGLKEGAKAQSPEDKANSEKAQKAAEKSENASNKEPDSSEKTALTNKTDQVAQADKANKAEKLGKSGEAEKSEKTDQAKNRQEAKPEDSPGDKAGEEEKSLKKDTTTATEKGQNEASPKAKSDEANSEEAVSKKSSVQQSESTEVDESELSLDELKAKYDIPKDTEAWLPGTYEAGKDIDAGTYCILGQEFLFTVAKNKEGDKDHLVASGTNFNREYIRVDKGLFLSFNSGILLREKDAPEVPDGTEILPPGTYSLGVDLLQGNYTLHPLNEFGGYYALLADVTHQNIKEIFKNENFNEDIDIRVPNIGYLTLSDCELIVYSP